MQLLIVSNMQYSNNNPSPVSAFPHQCPFFLLPVPHSLLVFVTVWFTLLVIGCHSWHILAQHTSQNDYLSPACVLFRKLFLTYLLSGLHSNESQFSVLFLFWVYPVYGRDNSLLVILLLAELSKPSKCTKLHNFTFLTMKCYSIVYMWHISLSSHL